jgi:hypothetical protein
MEYQNNASFFDMVIRANEDWPMEVDELQEEEDERFQDVPRQVGYEDVDGNLRDENGILLFVRRISDSNYMSFDEVRPYDDEYINFLNDQHPDNTIMSYETFLELHGLPLSIRKPEELEENMLERIILYTVDPPVCAKTVGMFECPICLDEACLTQKVVPSCKHEYCKTCMMKHLESFQSRQLVPCCALCRAPYSLLEIFEPTVFKEVTHCVRREV